MASTWVQQIDLYGVDAVRLTVVFAGPEDGADWAAYIGQFRCKRAYRLATEVASDRGVDYASGERTLRQATHRAIRDVTDLVGLGRFNVAIARVMELVNATRKAIDSGSGAADPAVREAVTFVAQALSLVAPYVAEEIWEQLGEAPSVANSTWPTPEPELLVAESVTMVVQVQGKVRAKLEVSPDITEQEATDLALADPNVQRALDGRGVAKVITRLPKMVSVVPAG